METQTASMAPESGAALDEPAERLDARVVPYWILTSLLFVAFLAAAGTVGATFLLREYPEHGSWLVPAALALLGLLVAVAVLQPVLSYVVWRFSVDEQLLIARYGILFRTEKVIPISRMQHVDLTRGPVERTFGLATLVVFTAGTEEASFRVAGLRVARARELRDMILAARGDDVL